MPNNHRNHRTTKPSAAKSLREVEFRFESPNAKSVHLAGDFNEWATNSLPLRKESPGQWRARAAHARAASIPLRRGRSLGGRPDRLPSRGQSVRFVQLRNSGAVNATALEGDN